jgi:hypothetical protein
MTSLARPEVRSDDVRRWLPLALVLVLLGIAVATAFVAPSRNDAGINLVFVGDGRAGPLLSIEDLACERTGGQASCTATAVPLSITVDYPESLPGLSECSAVLAGQAVQCRSQMGDYGNASHNVFLSGVGDLLAGHQPSVPWWRTSSGMESGVLWATAILAAVFGVAALGGRQAWPVARRTELALGMGVVGVVAFAVMGQLVSGQPTASMAVWSAAHPISVLGAAALGLWQWSLGGPAPATRTSRTRAAITAVLVTGFSSFVFLFVMLLMAGVVD